MSESKLLPWKVGLTAVVLLMVVVFILQNTTPQEVRFLFLRATLPSALLVLVSFLMGMVVAAVLAVSAARSSPRRKERSQ